MTYSSPPGQTLQFYLTAAYPCSYLDGVQARSQVLLPGEVNDNGVYSQLVELGFRRSGHYVYRPRCDHCHACLPARICVDEFSPSRSQRRTWKRLGGLHARIVPLTFEQEHFELYCRYQRSRHPGGGMDEDGESQYAQFMLSSPVSSALVEFRDGERLVMVSLIDQLDSGISAVYAFYDPEPGGAGYGVFNVLWQVELCRQLQLPYVYLGYYIENCRKMNYKMRYQPLELYIDGRWQSAPAGGADAAPMAADEI